MDKLSVHHGHHNGISKPPVHHHGHGGKGGGKGKGKGAGWKGIKVVYISSPIKLTASAEEFRAVVQELTGRDSNVADHDVAGAPPPYASFGRASPTAVARAVPPTMATASPGAGRTAEYAAGVAAPPPFQSMYDQAAGSLLYGQDYW